MLQRVARCRVDSKFFMHGGVAVPAAVPIEAARGDVHIHAWVGTAWWATI